MSPPHHQVMPIADLRLSDYNPRRISEPAMVDPSTSIERFGLVVGGPGRPHRGRVPHRAS